MIQLALRSSIQAELPLASARSGQDRRQRDGRDHELEPGEEHAGPEHGKQHDRRAAVHAGSVWAGGRAAWRRPPPEAIVRCFRSSREPSDASAPISGLIRSVQLAWNHLDMRIHAWVRRSPARAADP